MYRINTSIHTFVRRLSDKHNRICSILCLWRLSASRCGVATRLLLMSATRFQGHSALRGGGTGTLTPYALDTGTSMGIQGYRNSPTWHIRSSCPDYNLTNGCHDNVKHLFLGDAPTNTGDIGISTAHCFFFNNSSMARDYFCKWRRTRYRRLC